MGITLEMVIGVVVLTALGLLLTGPGMWSEKWGWRFLRRDRGSAAKAAGESPSAKPRDDPARRRPPRDGS
jgi:hypothetical protein